MDHEKKKKKSLILGVIFCALALPLGCKFGETGLSERTFLEDYIPLSHSISHFNDIFEIEKVVQLETTKDSLLGTIDQVVLDSSNGNLIVGDFERGKSVLRFSNNGEFISKYHLEGLGPGECEFISGIAVLQNTNIVIICNRKMMCFDSGWRLIKEIKLDTSAEEVASAGNRLFVLGTNTLFQESRHSVHIYDENLESLGQFHPYDTRIDKYHFRPWSNLALVEDKVYITHLYDLAISIYDLSGKHINTLSLSSTNKELDFVWEKTPLREHDRHIIRDKTHRFLENQPSTDGLILLDYQREESIYDMYFLDHKNGNLTRYKGYHPLKRGQDDIRFFMLVGGYSGGTIGVIEDPEEFKKFRGYHEAFNDISFTVKDNPLLVFFKIKPGEKE